MPNALSFTGASVTRQALHARIGRWRNGLKPPASTLVNNIFASRSGTTTNVVPPPLEATATPSESTVITPATNKSSRITPAISAALDNLPSWLDRDKTQASMIVRKRRSASQVNRDDFEAKAKSAYYSKRYTAAKKEATLKFKSYRDDPEKWGKRGYGVVSVVNEVNNRMLTSPNDRKLSKSAVFDCVMADAAGTTPKKRGRPSKIPSPLPLALAQHAVMLQVSGEGEATGAAIKCLAEGIVSGTEWENKFNTEYVWRKSRRLHPEILMPHSAKNNEDRRVDWMSYSNIMEWTARAKEFLISIGMAKDEPGMIRK